MRLVLLDWVCQVSTDYHIKRQSFHRAVEMINEFLDKSPRKF